MTSNNLASLIQQHAIARPGKVAIELGDTTLTYLEIWQRIVSLSQWLADQGCVPGSRIAVALPETIDHVLMQFAVPAIGGVYIPVDHRWSTNEQQAAISSFGAQLLIGGDHNTLATPLPETLPATTQVELAPGDDQDWLISLSSGSTGRPTGALVTHRHMRERFIAQWVTLGFNIEDRFALVTPLCFGAGRSFSMSTLAAGATLIVAPPPMAPEAVVDYLTSHRASATFMVPTLLRRLAKVTGKKPLLPMLRRLLLSGEPTSASEARVFQADICPNLIGYYASSEGGGISVLQPDDFTSHAHTVGQAAFGVDIDIVDHHDVPVGDNEPGRLRYRGPGVTNRLLDADGRLQQDDDGWFYPGDLADRDSDGYITLRSRSKDVIVRSGINIYPAELERVISSLDGVSQVVVVGVPCTARGESVHAWVVGAVTVDALEAHCKQHLARYKQPETFHLTSHMPLTPAGKIDRQSLRNASATNAGN